MKEKRLIKKSLLDFASESMYRYGTHVIENRAIPDFRDALKPVQRRILWSMYEDHMGPSSPFKKVARICGNVMGKYHPHGDSSITNALVNMAGTFETKYSQNTPVPYVYGQGNFGEMNGQAAASRYIEAKLTKFSSRMMLDSNYMNVVPLVPNYDGLEKEPFYLPSLLPSILLNGAAGIAVGVITGIPAFHIKGVLEIVKIGLKNKITVDDCIKNLKVHTLFGGEHINTKKEMREFYETGEGQLLIGPSIEEKEGKLHIIGGSPYFNAERAQLKILNFDNVVRVDDFGSKDDPIHLVVTFKRGMSDDDLDKLIDKCYNSLISSQTLRLNVIERHDENRVTFHSHLNGLTMPKLIDMWIKWRVQLEVDCQKYIAGKLRKEIHYNEILLLATNSLEKIKRELQRKAPDFEKRLAKTLKISIEDAQIIAAMQVKRLSALSKVEIQKVLKEKNRLLKQAIHHSKNPRKKILSDLSELKLSEFQ